MANANHIRYGKNFLIYIYDNPQPSNYIKLVEVGERKAKLEIDIQYKKQM